ncbi:Transcriptional regulatory protein SrrA [compost metagenome]
MESKEELIRIKDIAISTAERMVQKNDEWIDLTPKEYDLLMMLYQYRGRIFTRTELLDTVWGYEYVGDTRTVDTHIQRLRKKLGFSDLITTVFSIGYKFEK